MNRLAKLFRLGFSIYSLAALLLAASAQPIQAGPENTPVNVRITQVDEAQYPTVKVYVSATGADGEPMAIAPEHLRLAENGAVVTPDQISAAGEIGRLTTLLIMDASGGMNQAGKLQAAQIAARAYIGQMRADDQAGLLTFNDDINYLQPVTTDHAELEKALSGLQTIGNTAMYDALLRGVQILDSIPGRKAVILMTDGLDNRSKHTVDQVLDQIGLSRVSIMTIGLGDPTQLGHSPAALDEAALKSLAERAGGAYGYAEDPLALLDLYERFGRALQAEYALTYTALTPVPEGEKRSLTVSLNNDSSTTIAIIPGGVGAPTKANPTSAATANLIGGATQAAATDASNSPSNGIGQETHAPATVWEILGWVLAGLMVLPLIALSIPKAFGKPDRLASVWERFKQLRLRFWRANPLLSPTQAAEATELPVFPNYLQLRSHSRLSPRFWSWARLIAVLLMLVCVALLFLAPATGLFLFWRLTIPLLPALFLLAPGIWRNVCPLAASNQLPRWLNISRALTPPTWLQEYGFVFGVIAFFLFASSRKWLFNSDGPATGVLILFALASALLGGYLFKGKSGWCTSICPLYPVQRLYNRTPFVTVPNAHCSPCVGCTAHCYDFKPGDAYLADLHDTDPHYANYRKFFAAAMPGFIVAYFTLANPTGLMSALGMYLQFALSMVLSIGVFTILESFLKVSPGKLTAVYGAAAFNLFYWFGLPSWLSAVGSLVGVTPPMALAWILQILILGMTGVWVARTYRNERLFQNERAQAEALNLTVAPTLLTAAQPGAAAITFMPGETRVPVEAGRTLLEMAESSHQPLSSGCRMGVCGADPVLILEGMSNLPPVGSDEKGTLERLGLGPNCRLACMCRPNGPVTVSLQTKAVPAAPVAPAAIATTMIEAPTPVTAERSAVAPAVAGKAEITFMPDEVRVPIEAGRTLLEIAENNGQPLEAGCRMGVCGADPILILDGMQNLPPIGSDEKSTLERLGLGPNCRLACMCRPRGPVTVSLQTKGAPASVTPAPTDFDPSLKSVVIIGNGVAGVTAADQVRRLHPQCDIHVIGREKHPLYNRMAITRLIYGRSAMGGLYLQPEAWYDERKITCWLNTHVTHINRGHKQVELATGERLAYDRLILASGSSSFVPPIPGYGRAGTFVLREAEEAMEIRAYVQQQQCRTAVIAGGGLLGLEAAYAMHKLGLTVWVLERGTWLLRRQLDERGGKFLKHYLEALGLMIVTEAEAAAVEGNGHVTEVALKGGRRLPCDVFLVAAGIQPNVELARAAGLDVKRGVLVDEGMRTNAAEIFAAGDVCEYEEQVPGLWPVAVEQAKVAAINAVGGEATYQEGVAVTMLKVVGVELTSVGRIETQSEDEEAIMLEDEAERRYRKLVIADGKLVGAILLGYPQDAPAVTAAVKASRDVSGCLDALRAGQWQVLQESA